MGEFKGFLADLIDIDVCPLVPLVAIRAISGIMKCAWGPMCNSTGIVAVCKSKASEGKKPSAYSTALWKTYT